MSDGNMDTCLPLLWRRATNEWERGPFSSSSCNHAQAWGGGAELSGACNLRSADSRQAYELSTERTGRP